MTELEREGDIQIRATADDRVEMVLAYTAKRLLWTPPEAMKAAQLLWQAGRCLKRELDT